MQVSYSALAVRSPQIGAQQRRNQKAKAYEQRARVVLGQSTTVAMAVSEALRAASAVTGPLGG